MIQPSSVSPVRHHGSLPANQPKFSSLSMNGMGKRLLNQVDFKEMGAPNLNQIKIIYTCCILWRLIAANERRKASPSKSWNEIRESMLRDFVGFMFWFFATPMLQRGYLGATTSPEIRNALIQRNQDKGHFLRKFNPLYNWDIPSSEQVRDQAEQALAALRKQGIQHTDDAYKTTEAFYGQLTKARNLATGVGLVTTILLLGIGINLFNIHLTRKNVARRQAEALKNRQPVPPHSKAPAATGSLQRNTPTMMGARQSFNKPPLSTSPFQIGFQQTNPAQSSYGNAFNPALFNPNFYAAGVRNPGY